MPKGKLIIFEGISGTGKETQAKLLKDYLSQKGISSIIVYHPSPELKEILSKWRKDRHIDYISEAYFLLADRYNRVQQIIRPALAKGQWVISLRNWVSALVYQAKTPKDRAYLRKEFLWFEPRADKVFYFRVTPEEALKRVMKRHRETGEALGKFETAKLLKEKCSAYDGVFKKIPHAVIEATQSIQAIHQTIVKSLAK